MIVVRYLTRILAYSCFSLCASGKCDGKTYQAPVVTQMRIHMRGENMNNFQQRVQTLQPLTISDNKKLDETLRLAIMIPAWVYQITFVLTVVGVYVWASLVFPGSGVLVSLAFTVAFMLPFLDGLRLAERTWTGGKKPFPWYGALSWIIFLSMMYDVYTLGYGYILPVFIFLFCMGAFSSFSNTVGRYMYWHSAGCKKFNLPQ